MKSLDLSALAGTLKKNRYVLAVLAVGLLLLLLPRRSAEGPLTASAPAQSDARGDPMAASGIPLAEESERVAALLSAARGVGAARVLLSAGGCVIACEGADDPAVRLDVTNAVAAYTGLGSDKIYVLKMQ